MEEHALRSARQAALRGLPDDVTLSHLTAAQVYGLALPELPSWLPVLASRPPGTDRFTKAGLYIGRSRAGSCRPWVTHCDLAVVAPAVCVAQLAQDLSLVDLVAAIDSALDLQLCTIHDIEAGLRARQNGLPLLRRALSLCDARSESAWESVLPLMHHAAGIPVEPQHVVRTPEGDLVARADLRITGTKRLPEYDGADHRARSQHERDLRREKLLARHGWERYGYIATEIIHQPATIISDAEAALSLESSPGRLTSWQRMSRDSSLTGEGKRRLLQRLQRFVHRRRRRVPRVAAS